MLSARLVELIEIHASQLTNDVIQDLATNPRTPGFRTISREELEQRLYRILHHLGNWIGDARSAMVEHEFSEWGSQRFDQGIPISEIVYAIVVLKNHLHRYIRDNGLVEAAFPRTDGDYVLPMHLYSLQDLNARVGEFFDESLYYVARGYEQSAHRVPAEVAH
jgi:hypothetical protein